MPADLTEAHRLAQLRLGALTIRQLQALFRLLDPDDLDGSFEDWLTTIVTVIQAQRATSARLAAAFLVEHRQLALPDAERLTPVLAAAADPKAIAVSMLVTGPISIRSNLARRVDIGKALDIAKARTAAAGMRHALNGGRDTITSTIAADKRTLGYQRVTSAKACDFCSMLASRGAVYGAESATFEAHDGCSCAAEPVYR